MSAGGSLGVANPLSSSDRFRRLAAKRGILLPNSTSHNNRTHLPKWISLNATC